GDRDLVRTLRLCQPLRARTRARWVRGWFHPARSARRSRPGLVLIGMAGSVMAVVLRPRERARRALRPADPPNNPRERVARPPAGPNRPDRKSTRLNSSHVSI